MQAADTDVNGLPVGDSYPLLILDNFPNKACPLTEMILRLFGEFNVFDKRAEALSSSIKRLHVNAFPSKGEQVHLSEVSLWSFEHFFEAFGQRNSFLLLFFLGFLLIVFLAFLRFRLPDNLNCHPSAIVVLLQFDLDRISGIKFHVLRCFVPTDPRITHAVSAQQDLPASLLILPYPLDASRVGFVRH